MPVDPNNPLGLHANHPLRIGFEQQRAAGARALASTPIMRPDNPMPFRTNDPPPPASTLMDPSRIYARHQGDANFGGSLVGSGAMGVAGSDVMTGGGAMGSLRAQQAGQQRGQAMMASLPPLQPMLPYVKGSQPNTAQKFRDVDRQVTQMAANERATGHANVAEDPLVAAHMNYQPPAQGAGGAAKPMGVAATAPAGAPGRFADLPRNVFAPAPSPAAPGNAFAPDMFDPPLVQPGAAAPDNTPRPLRTQSGGQIDPRFVGNRQQVMRAQIRTGQRPAPQVAAAPGKPAVPVEGVRNGMAGIGQMLKNLFGGGVGAGLMPGAQQEQPPSVQMLADAKAELDHWTRRGYGNAALENYNEAKKLAMQTDLQWHAQKSAERQHMDQMGLGRAQMAARSAQDAAELAERKRTNDAALMTAAAESKRADAQAAEFNRKASMTPEMRATEEAVGAGRLPPAALASAQQREALLKTALQKFAQHQLTTGEAREVLTTPNNPFGTMITPDDYKAIFAADRGDNRGMGAYQQARSLHYPVGPEHEGEPVNEMFRMLMQDYAGADNWRQAQSRPPQEGFFGQRSYPTTAYRRNSLGQGVGGNPLASTFMMALSGYNPFGDQEAPDRDYQQAQEYWRWANGRKQ